VLSSEVQATGKSFILQEQFTTTYSIILLGYTAVGVSYPGLRYSKALAIITPFIQNIMMLLACSLNFPVTQQS
jgi:uncharacterized membrane protein